MFNYEFPPLGGGFGQYYLLARELVKKGHQVKYVTSRMKGQKTRETIEGIELIRVKTSRKQRDKASFLAMLTYLTSTWTKIDDIVDDFQPDIIHLFFGIPTGALIFHSKLKKYPTILSTLGSDVPGHSPDRYLLLYKILIPVVKKIWQKHNLVVANSQDLADEITNINPKQKIRVIPNGIDIKQFQPNQKKQKGNILKFLYVGRLIPLKRIDLALKIFAEIDNTVEKKCFFNIVGSGTEKSHLIELTNKLGIKDKVNFKGYIPHEKIEEEFQKANFYLQFSKAEGMSNTTMEAMACGAIPVISNVGGGSKLVKHLENGLIYRSNDLKIRKIVKDLNKIIDSNNLSKKMSQKARKAIVDNYSQKTLTNNYLKSYRQLIKKFNE
jgi:glycosyltransferase involved in cell wall biosynthesis